VLTSRLCVIHCLPSAIRLEEYIVPDAFWSCAESRSHEALTDQNAILNAIDTAKTRIGLVLCLILVMHDLHRVPNHSTCDDCASHQTAGQQNGSGAKKVTPDGVAFTGAGKLVRKPTGYEQQKAEAARSRTGSRAARAEVPAAIGAYR